jgi:hypothetical protein
MDRYKNSKIYKIVDNTNGNVYIGSTCEPTLAHRLAKHRGHYREYLKGGNRYITSFKILENNDYSIVLLEEFPCETKDQLLARERYYIENNECVNKKIPTRTKKEWTEKNQDKIIDYQKKYQKKYQEQNQDKLKIYQEEYQEEYRKQNQDKLKEYQEEYRKKNKQYKIDLEKEINLMKSN